MPIPTTEHLNRQIPPEAHTPMYVWHKYWSRKTWNVVSEFIEAYSNPNDLVLDPFGGSGVVAIECARRGRRAVIIDRNPVAGMITDLTLRPVNLVSLKLAFRRVKADVQRAIDDLYRIHCVQCKGDLIGDAFVREGDMLLEVRYQKCPHCGFRCEGFPPLPEDSYALTKAEEAEIPFWYPTNPFEYPDGTPFKKRERYRRVDELFTKRNLRALAILHDAIEKEPSPLLKRFLLAGFSSALHLCTRMMPVGKPQPTNHYTYFSSPGWTQHSYWSAPKYMEQNVWAKFESAISGPQGIVKAKEESERVLPRVRLTNDWRKVANSSADIAVVTGDCLSIMGEMNAGCIDYIFTDPPYADSIQYGELSLMWNAWLKRDRSYGEELITSEVVLNDRQKKNFDVYHSLLSRSFEMSFEVLKPERYASVTFHNPTFKVRNATVRAAVFAGFEYQKVHHQPLAQSSAQSMLQPFGSAQGDFYLRFYKAAPGAGNLGQLEEVSEERFRRIVIETCKEVIAERAEPTPYTILVNYIDPVLAKNGLFGTLNTGLDVKTVLDQAVGTEFILLDAQIGSARGKLWWFRDTVFAARLKETPLSERVERTVENTLRSRGRVTFTEVWDAVSREFPNSLTQDSVSIREALERYARPVGSPYWLLRDEVVERIRAHSEIIGLLALIGRAQGFDIWIGGPEQGAVAEGLAGSVPLRNLVSVRPQTLTDVTNLKDVLLMDILWIRNNTVAFAFEVESTTTMTSGLQRGSNLPSTTPKIMVLPEERQTDFIRKMQSPLFAGHFTNQNWALLFFDAFRSEYIRRGPAADVSALLGIMQASSSSVESAIAQQGHLTFSQNLV